MSAVISPCGVYRHLLSRPGASQCAFVMLNPSTADGVDDDATIRKCRRFARDWGYAGIVVGNCYDFRATKPADLWKHHAPVSAHNDAYLQGIATLPLIVAAWGTEAEPQRVKTVTQILRSFGAQLYCLGVNLDGSPRHPLYVPYDTKLQPFVG